MERDLFETPQDSENRWETPTVQVISLSCEITSYAPDDDGPLF